MEEMDEVVRAGLLLDFYGELLTKKQQRIMESYYMQNLSLAEIAAEEDISRQAVHDLLHRSLRSLEDLEEKLMLLAEYRKREKDLNELKSMLIEVKDKLTGNMRNKIAEILNKIETLSKA